MATSVSYVKVTWDATPVSSRYTGSKYYLASARTTTRDSPWYPHNNDHVLVSGTANSGWSVWAYPTSSTTTWSDMVGKTVIVAEKTSSTNYQTVNPGGVISSVAATEYTYSATVGSGGGGTISGAESKVVYSSGGERITGLAATFTAISSQGYTFSGWSGDTGNAAISKNTATVPNTVMSDVALVANFVEVERTVSFNANGGGVSPVSATGGVATAVTLPLPVRTGYTFLGWYTAASGGTLVGGSGSSYNPSKDITLYAHWSAISYTIAFDANGGTGSMASVAAAGGSQVTLPACTYTKTGSLFVGWNTAADGSGDSYADEATVLNLSAEDGATVTLYAQWKTLHTITAAQVGGADVVDLSFDPSAATTIGEVAYWTYGTHVAVTVTPHAGKLLNGGGISVNGVSQGSFTNSDPSAPYTFSLFVTGDMVIVPVVEQRTFACTATIDEASAAASAITAASASPSSVNYGGNAEFGAVVAENFSFDGWYDGDGNLVSSENPYTAEGVSADIVLTARASAQIQLSVSDAEHAVLYVNGEECTGGAFGGILPVGTQISFSILAASGYGLDAWKSGTTVLPMGATGTIVVNGPLSATAEIKANSELSRKVTVIGVYGEGNTPVSANDFVTFTEVAEQVAVDSGSMFYGDVPEPGICEGEFIGTKLTRATAQQTVTEGGVELYFLGWFNPGDNYRPGTLITRELSLDILTNEDKSFFVKYGPSQKVDVSVGVTADSGAGGAVWITATVDGEPVGDKSTTSLEQFLGDEVTVHARAMNGFVFNGWYIDNPNPSVFTPVSTDTDFTFTVYAQRSVYARFVLNRNAICEWEGSDENKTMTWRSKTYEASKPFNPSGCRVDARGYRPENVLDLTVDMFSAPDADARPTAHTTLSNIANQDARRLPVRRMERYMQVEVVANSEVDALLVGTSMGGLVV